jgi:hypothetical protein
VTPNDVKEPEGATAAQERHDQHKENIQDRAKDLQTTHADTNTSTAAAAQAAWNPNKVLDDAFHGNPVNAERAAGDADYGYTWDAKSGKYLPPEASGFKPLK